MKILATLTFLILLCSSQALAHKDRIIRVLRDGQLSGLPDQYKPAKFYLESMNLRIAEKSIIFPSCIADYFSKSTVESMKFTSSWYHESKRLPPYLAIESSHGRDEFYVHLLLSLDSLDVLSFEKVFEGTDSSSRYIKIDLSDTCASQLKKAIKSEVFPPNNSSHSAN